MEVSSVEEEGEVAFLNLMDCSAPRDSVEEVLRFLSLQWSADNDQDHVLAESSCISEEGSLRVGKWFGVERFCLIKGTIRMVKEKFAFQPFRCGEACPFRPIYIKRFYR